MIKKKILVVSRSFYPENSPRSFRTTELVKEFCRQGHDVTLYTFKDDAYHVPIEKEFGVKIKDLGKRKFKYVELKNTGKISFLFRRVLRRMLLVAFEYPDIEIMFKVKKALKHESGYDLMVSIAVPHPVHWGVAWARTKEHPIAKVWAADCGDPYMGTGKQDTFKKPFYFKYLEKSFCSKADYITLPNINMKVNYYQEFWPRIREITQGFKFDEVQLEKQPVNNPVPTFAFAGVFMRSVRNPVPLIEYLVSTGREFKFVVYSKSADLILPFKEVLKDKLEIREYVPRLALLKELSKMDFLLNIGYDPAQQLPSKLIDYYLTGRPILMLREGVLDKTMVDEFLDGNYNKAFKSYNLDQYKIENVCRLFLNLAGNE